MAQLPVTISCCADSHLGLSASLCSSTAAQGLAGIDVVSWTHLGK